jgi:RNA polymerase-binding transcription factor DksA
MPLPEVAAGSNPGVEAMTSEKLKLYKERILALRRRLRADVGRMAVGVLDNNLAEANGDLSLTPSHTADIGGDDFEREFTLGLVEYKEDILEQIEGALQRMEDGVYGLCESCGAMIPQVRLNAIPYAIRCVKCASQLEWA